MWCPFCPAPPSYTIKSRQLEQKFETRETARRLALVKALEFELAGMVGVMGGTFVGFAIAYEEEECRLIYKADFEGRRRVAFVYSDTIMNCIIKAVRMAKNHKLKWKLDKYAPRKT